MQHFRAVGPVERQVRALMYAAASGMTVGKPADAVGGHEFVLLTQIVSEHFRRYRCVLPAGPRRIPVFGAPGQTAGVGTDPPQGARLFARRQDAIMLGPRISSDGLSIGDGLIRRGT